ncbi:DNA-binding protein [Aggregatibacter actinomycetemcomitans]|uniref:DNA-binding protein n=1 Tax=Aggregatibacter actinomycetemcomitans TaxID=714 RepID=UPI0021CCCB48|nr:DNA-binding protein [Aggregatibacter actinomycetemcomitans]
MWFSATVLSFLETLPNSPQGINKKARIENWERRKVVGKKGASFEYSFKSLPQETQAELILKSSEKSAVENLDRLEIPAPQRKQLNYLPEALWIAYDKANQKKKEKAEHRFKAVCAVTDLVANGTDTITALVKAGERFGESWKTINRLS